MSRLGSRFVPFGHDDKYPRARNLRPSITTNYLITASNGFAKANNIATPTPIKNAASIKPANKNILVCSGSINSG
jgi:uncharacterized protein YgbK (DUF1537 family)